MVCHGPQSVLVCFGRLNSICEKYYVFTYPAARTLPSVEKAQQSPLFKGATCTGYSSSILQNLTILERKNRVVEKKQINKNDAGVEAQAMAVDIFSRCHFC